LPAVLTVSLAVLVLSAGLQASLDDLLYLVRRPRKLLAAVLAVSVIVPAVAVVMVDMLPLQPMVKAGIILMAVSPLPPFVPSKALKAGGRHAYVLGLFAAFAVLSVAIVPASVALLSAWYAVDVSISPMAIGRTMLISVLAPLAIGLAIRALAPRFAEAAAPLIAKLSMLLLLGIVAVILANAWPAILGAIGDGSVLAITVIVLAGVAGGVLLGGPDQRDRVALAVAAATRHPGIALLIANANFQDKRISAILLLFMLVALGVVGVCQLLFRRAAHRDTTAASMPDQS
jgi:BASS family bile acid:Na+ symporter